VLSSGRWAPSTGVGGVAGPLFRHPVGSRAQVGVSSADQIQLLVGTRPRAVAHRRWSHTVRPGVRVRSSVERARRWRHERREHAGIVARRGAPIGRVERGLVAVPDDPPAVGVVEAMVLRAEQRGIAQGQLAAEPERLGEMGDLAPLGRDRAPTLDAAAVTKLQGPPQTGRDGPHLPAHLQRDLFRIDQYPRHPGIGQQAANLVEGQRAQLIDLHHTLVREDRPPVDRDDHMRTDRVPLGSLGRSEGDVAHLDQRIRTNLVRSPPVLSRDLGGVRTAKPLDGRRNPLRVDPRKLGRQVEHPVRTGRHPQRPTRTTYPLVTHRHAVAPLDQQPPAELGELDRIRPRRGLDQFGLQPADRIPLEVA
jgi:hypothetical protein